MDIVATTADTRADAPWWDGDVVETFAGPGGWSEALKALGIHGAVGYEKDPAACATAEKAGHKRIQADVSMVDLRPLADLARLLLIGSPPCQSFSPAGKQKGKLDKPRILAHVARIRAQGRWSHYSREGWHDDRSPLVLEPLRWALTLRPEVIALEQVASVLPLWEAFADVLRDHGWHVDTGVLSAEQYGVPQTRKRAFLIARRCTPCQYAPGAFTLDYRCPFDVTLPAPTHRPYRKGVPQAEGDPALLPWVSMAEALGWTPGALVGFPRRPDTCAGHAPAGGGQCAKHRDDDLVTFDGVEYKRRDLRSVEEPAKSLTEKVRSWQLRQSAQSNATVRHEGEPAPTITAGHDRAERVWEQRPATTVQGDARIWPPGHKVNQDDRDRLGADEANERYGDRAGTKAVRVSVAEAAVLQSVRPDYPWQGSKTAQYRQVGDAVPPLLAEAVLRAAIGGR